MNQTIELEHYSHKVGINFWHINWQTKYRYNMFAKFKYKKLCEACIRWYENSVAIKQFPEKSKYKLFFHIRRDPNKRV